MTAFNSSLPANLSSIANDEGPKVSIYLTLSDGLLRTKGSLLAIAGQLLSKEMGKADVAHFLSPVARWTPEDWWNGSIGIFRTQSKCIFVRLPYALTPKVVVSQSFHIKPLIWCKQRDGWVKIFLLTQNSVHVYDVTASEVVGPAVYSNPMNGFLFDSQTVINSHLKTDDRCVGFVLAGEARFLSKVASLTFTPRPWIARATSVEGQQVLDRLVQEARKLLAVAEQRKQRSEIAEALKQPNVILESRPHQIIRALQEKTVKKVFVSLEDSLWGELDPVTGAVKFNPRQMNSRDDDILDDLLEISASLDIEYRVVPKRLLPFGICAVAC